jgi:hypothetical protein
MDTLSLLVAYCFLIIMVITMVWIPTSCIVRFVSATFSSKARSLIKTQPIAHTFWVLGTILIIAGIGYPLASDRLPSDKNLVDHFDSHESTYKSLVDMLSQDKTITSIYVYNNEMSRDATSLDKALYFVRPFADYGFSPDRFRTYKDMLTSIGAVSFWRGRDGSFHFSKGGWGFASYGARWGYEFRDNPPPSDKIIDSVDHFKQSINHNLPDEPHYFRYRLIKDNWYIVVAW